MFSHKTLEWICIGLMICVVYLLYCRKVDRNSIDGFADVDLKPVTEYNDFVKELQTKGMTIPGNVTVDGFLKVRKQIVIDSDDPAVWYKRKNKSCYVWYAASDGGFSFKKLTNKNRDPYAGVGNNNGSIRTSWGSDGRLRPKKGLSVTGGGTYLGGTQVTGQLTLNSSSGNRKWKLSSLSSHSQFQIKGHASNSTTDKVWFAVSGKDNIAYWGADASYLVPAQNRYNTTTTASTNSDTMVNNHRGYMLRMIYTMWKMGDHRGHRVHTIEPGHSDLETGA